MKKEHDIVMLPSESGVIMSEVGAYDTDMVLITELPKHLRTSDRPHNHLYILSDEEIKKGDWFINLGSGGHPGVAIYKANSENSKAINEFKYPEIKKIIATTDTELHYNKVVEEDIHMYKESLPHIPQHIIEAYVKKPFDKVMVEYECLSGGHRTRIPICQQPNPGSRYNKTHVGGIPTYKLKLNQDGTLAVSLAEEKMYSKEEIEDLMGLGYELGKQGGSLEDLKKLKENL
jgi:hypothetical protein